jgi:dynein heavy chain
VAWFLFLEGANFVGFDIFGDFCLYHRWYPAILNSFFNPHNQSQWSSLPADRIEPFFRTVSEILATQFRAILETAVKDFVSLFTHPSQGNSDKPYHSVTFIVRLVLENTKSHFEPALPDVLTVVDDLFEQLLVSLDRVPRIETQLFASNIGGAKDKLVNLRGGAVATIKIAFKETHPTICKEAKMHLREVVAKNLEFPHIYMRTFDKHQHLITKTAEADVESFLKAENGLVKETEACTGRLQFYKL